MLIPSLLHHPDVMSVNPNVAIARDPFLHSSHPLHPRYPTTPVPAIILHAYHPDALYAGQTLFPTRTPPPPRWPIKVEMQIYQRCHPALVSPRMIIVLLRVIVHPRTSFHRAHPYRNVGTQSLIMKKRFGRDIMKLSF